MSRTYAGEADRAIFAGAERRAVKADYSRSRFAARRLGHKQPGHDAIVGLRLKLTCQRSTPCSTVTFFITGRSVSRRQAPARPSIAFRDA